MAKNVAHVRLWGWEGKFLTLESESIAFLKATLKTVCLRCYRIRMMAGVPKPLWECLYNLLNVCRLVVDGPWNLSELMIVSSEGFEIVSGQKNSETSPRGQSIYDIQETGPHLHFALRLILKSGSCWPESLFATIQRLQPVQD